MSAPKDDLEAVRAVVDAIKDFKSDEQQRIFRWGGARQVFCVNGLVFSLRRRLVRQQFVDEVKVDGHRVSFGSNSRACSPSDVPLRARSCGYGRHLIPVKNARSLFTQDVFTPRSGSRSWRPEKATSMKPPAGAFPRVPTGLRDPSSR